MILALYQSHCLATKTQVWHSRGSFIRDMKLGLGLFGFLQPF